MGNAYGTWVGRFIAGLQAYHDVLIWGLNWGGATQNPAPSSAWNPFWAGSGGYAGAYPEILATVQSYPYSSPAGRALLMVQAGFGQQAPPQPPPQPPYPSYSPVTSWGWPYGPYYSGESNGCDYDQSNPSVPPQCVLPILSGIQWTFPTVCGIQSLGQVQCDSGTGYQWTWQQSQQAAYNWQQYAGYSSEDVYAFGMYNASAADLQAALKCVNGTPVSGVCSTTPAAVCGSSQNQSCRTIPYSHMIVGEVATGSSFDQPPVGNGVAGAGDVQTPTSSAAGQAQWLTDTLCVLTGLGIQATGWYGLYDSASWWEAAPLSLSGAGLAWNGYWGLMSETGAAKDAWTNFLGYPGNCPSAPLPVLALTTDATYYTVGNPAIVTWGAADVTSLSLNQTTTGGVYSCNSANEISQGTSLLGSCASTTVTMPSTPQQVTITLSGVPNGTAASKTVTVGPGPTIDHVVNDTSNQICWYTQNPSCTINATQLDTISIYGAGFDSTGGNTVRLVAGGITHWLHAADGYYYWDGSPGQINAQIGCYVTPGLWTFDVWNPYQQIPSSSHSINVAHSSGCP